MIETTYDSSLATSLNKDCFWVYTSSTSILWNFHLHYDHFSGFETSRELGHPCKTDGHAGLFILSVWAKHSKTGAVMPLVAAYIVPHPPLAVAEIGRGEERKIDATLQAYRNVMQRIAAIAPERIIFMSPHSAYYSDWIFVGSGNGSTGNFAAFGAPDVSFSLSYDVDFGTAMIERCQKASLPVGYIEDHARPLDHGILVPLSFLEQYYPSDSYRALSIGGSGLARDKLMQFGRILAETAQGNETPQRTEMSRGTEAAHKPEKTVLLTSGDLSHKLTVDGPYGFDEAGPQFDEAFRDVVNAGDPSAFSRIDPAISEPAAECGLSGFIMLAGALEAASDSGNNSGDTFSSELLSYEGPFGVGYGVAAFERKVR